LLTAVRNNNITDRQCVYKVCGANGKGVRGRRSLSSGFLPAAAQPLGPLGRLVVDVLDLVHGIRSVDGHRHLLLDVHRIRFGHRVRHRFLHRVRDGLDDRHRVRHADGHRLRHADGHGPVHRHGYGAVDLHVLRDHLFGPVRVGGSVSNKNEISRSFGFCYRFDFNPLRGLSAARSVFIPFVFFLFVFSQRFIRYDSGSQPVFRELRTSVQPKFKNQWKEIHRVNEIMNLR